MKLYLWIRQRSVTSYACWVPGSTVQCQTAVVQAESGVVKQTHTHTHTPCHNCIYNFMVYTRDGFVAQSLFCLSNVWLVFISWCRWRWKTSDGLRSTMVHHHWWLCAYKRLKSGQCKHTLIIIWRNPPTECIICWNESYSGSGGNDYFQGRLVFRNFHNCINNKIYLSLFWCMSVWYLLYDVYLYD